MTGRNTCADGAYVVIIGEIEEGLGNEVFRTGTLIPKIDDPERIKEHHRMNTRLSLEVQQHGAHYGIVYDWNYTPYITRRLLQPGDTSPPFA